MFVLYFVPTKGKEERKKERTAREPWSGGEKTELSERQELTKRKVETVTLRRQRVEREMCTEWGEKNERRSCWLEKGDGGRI